ncbi:hypothetical protein BJX65DRAFT_286483 [Aspergillus insuetus]
MSRACVERRKWGVTTRPRGYRSTTQSYMGLYLCAFLFFNAFFHSKLKQKDFV